MILLFTKIEVKVLKTYKKPEIKIDSLIEIDVIATSVTGEDVVKGRFLKTSVAGNEGESYGQQSVTIYD